MDRVTPSSLPNAAKGYGGKDKKVAGCRRAARGQEARRMSVPESSNGSPTELLASGFRRADVVRLVTQCLHSLGYEAQSMLPRPSIAAHAHAHAHAHVHMCMHMHAQRTPSPPRLPRSALRRSSLTSRACSAGRSPSRASAPPYCMASGAQLMRSSQTYTFPTRRAGACVSWCTGSTTSSDSRLAAVPLVPSHSLSLVHHSNRPGDSSHSNHGKTQSH